VQIISKSPNRHLVTLQVKSKGTERDNNIYMFVSFCCTFQYNNVLVISRFQWLSQATKNKSCQNFDIFVS